MPKREKTPPPPDDEPKYLTVVHPYPPHANMELLGDQKEFSYWIASCTGKDVFLAFFYKPASPNMIIIEVTRDFQGWDRLLGEHRWSEVFQNPLAEHRDRVSQIFYCTFSTGRLVQKYGWKRINVEENWFTTWSPVNKLVTFPYPATHWCPVPVEDATNAPLCRSLPVNSFPPPQQTTRLPPVGAVGWQDARKSTTPNAWSKVPPAVTTQGLNRSSGNSSAARSPPSATSPNGNGVRPNAWGVPSPGITAPVPVYGPPPGLPPLGAYVASTPSGTYHTAPSTAWTVTSASSRASSSAGSDTTSDGGSIGGTPAPSEFQDAESVVEPPVDIASAMEELNVDENLWETATDDWNTGPYAQDEKPADVAEEPEEDLWSNWQRPAEKPKETETIICRVHGKVCPKGICREYKRQLREQERKKQEEERLAQKKKTSTKKRPQYEEKQKPANLRGRDAPTVPRSEAGSEAKTETTSEVELEGQFEEQSEGQTEERSSESPERERKEKITFQNRPKPPHLVHKGSSEPNDEDDTSPTSPSSTTSPASPIPPVSAARARPAHLMKGKGKSAPAAAKAPSAVPANAAAGPSTRPPPSDNGWGYIPRDPWGAQSVGAPSVNGDGKSVASSTGGWGRVSNGPWGSESVNGSVQQGKGKGKAKAKPNASGKQTTTNDAPKKSWADQMEDDDARSAAQSSTGGWGNISNGPW